MYPHLRKSGFRNPRKFCLWNPESRKLLFVEWGILGFGKRNTAQGIRNQIMIAIAGIHSTTSNDKESGIQYLESGIHGVESRIPDCLGFHYYLGRFINDMYRFGRYFSWQNTNLNNFRTRGFLWEDGKVGERNWWVPKNWKSEKKSQANSSIVRFQMTS